MVKKSLNRLAIRFGEIGKITLHFVSVVFFCSFGVMALGRPKNIESPKVLWNHFLKYKESVSKNPILVHDFVGKCADEVRRERQRPLTMEGFENWLEDNEIINNLSNYLANSNDAYSEFSTICSRIKRNIRQDQIEGGMAGVYNPSITQRLNGLTDKQDITTGGEKLQNNDIKIEIIKPIVD